MRLRTRRSSKLLFMAAMPTGVGLSWQQAMPGCRLIRVSSHYGMTTCNWWQTVCRSVMTRHARTHWLHNQTSRYGWTWASARLDTRFGLAALATPMGVLMDTTAH